MSKVLKIAAVGVGLAAVIASGGLGAAAAAAVTGFLGMGAATIGLISAGLSVGASLLAPKPKAPINSQENINRLRASIDPRTPRKTVVGTTALATDIRDEEFTDSQGFLHRFIVVASHKVHAIREIWFDDKKAWDDGGGAFGGVHGEFAGYLTVTPILEGSAANAINISARMGSTRRYTGLAYVHLRYKLTGNNKKTDSPFAQSITTRITIRGEGAYLYDPRLDSTVAGGSGTHRADDQTTWTWSDGACNNPALALLFYLLGWRINGKLAVGRGIPKARIDLASFAVAANLCDELVDDGSGGTEPRYRCAGVWSEGDAPKSVLDMLKATMNADLDDVDGKIRLTIFHNDLATPIADFSDSDVLGDFEWQKAPPLDESFNVIRGVFTDPSDASLYQPIDYPEVRETSPDGIDRVEPLDLPMVERASQCQRLAGLRLRRQRYGGGTFNAEFQATAWKLEKNAIMRLTFKPRGWVNKLFRVAEIEERFDGVVPLKLREEAVEIYDAPTLRPPVDPVPTSGYDPALAPVITALDLADQNLIATSYVTDADPADGLIQATATAITIESHTRTYTDRIVSITGTTLTADDTGASLVASVSPGDSVYHIYYDDPARAGGAVVFKATRNAQTAATGAANPGRHYVGSPQMDVSGGTGTSGGGATPPGWDPNDYR